MKVDFTKDLRVLRLQKKLDAGRATYADVWAYAELIGEMASKVGRAAASELLAMTDAYPVVMEFLEKYCHDPVSKYAQAVQAVINKKNGVNLLAVGSDFDENRASGIAHNVAHAETEDEIDQMLGPSLQNFTENTIADVLKANCALQAGFGLRPKINRIVDPTCCPWCSEVGGLYDFSDLPSNSEIWRRHDRCKCTIEFYRGADYKKDIGR